MSAVSLAPFDVELDDAGLPRELGRGGSSVVYAARRAGEPIALKVAVGPRDDDHERRFLEEAERLAQVHDDAIVRVLASGRLEDGRPFIAMPRLEGITLAQRLASGPLDLSSALRLFVALGRGVAALHEAGLVHRDIKPENVFLIGAREEERPILLDLGIARELDAGPSTLTRDGVVRGTPSCMAPERFFGQPATIASDVYELGLVLFMMLVGRLPWGDSVEVEDRLAAPSAHELDPAIPAGLGEALQLALATKPARRPASVEALLCAISGAAEAGESRRDTRAIPIRSDRPALLEEAPRNATPLAGSKRISESAPAPTKRAWPLLVGGAAAALAIGLALTQSARRGEGPSTDAAASPLAPSAEDASLPAANPEQTAALSADREAPAASVAISAAPEASATASAATTVDPDPTQNAAPLPSATNALAAATPRSLAFDVAPGADLPWCRKRAEFHCGEGSSSCSGLKNLVALQLKNTKPADRDKVNGTCKKNYESEKKAIENDKRRKEIMRTNVTCQKMAEKFCTDEVKQRIGDGPAYQLCSYYKGVFPMYLVDDPDPTKRCQKEIDGFDAIVEKQGKDAEKARAREAEQEKRDFEEFKREKERARMQPSDSRIFGLGQQ